MLEKILDFLKLFTNKQNTIVNIQPVPIAEIEPIKKFELKIDTANSLKWQYIIIHHSAAKDGETKDWEQIKKYHMSWRYNDESISEEKAKELIQQKKEVIAPWSDIGYHFGIEQISGQLQYLLGRPLSKSGAHAVQFNKIGIGICCLGDYDANTPSNELYCKTLLLVKELQRLYNIPDENVIGHRNTYDMLHIPREKSCPGTKWNLNLFRDMLKGKN